MAGMQVDPADKDPRELYRLMISVIVPRPIAWVSTVSPDGVPNAAPFSYFQALGSKPPTVMIAVGNRRTGDPKDTRRNIEATGEFVVNVVDEAAGGAMVRSSIDHPYGVSEFEEAGLEALPSERVAPPRIGGCAVSLECRLDRVLEIAGSGICIGAIVLFHVDDRVVGEDGLVDPVRLNPLGRMGGQGYATLRETVAIDQTGSVRTTHSAKLDLWRELRDRSIAMAGKLSTEQLAKGSGRILRHLAACTAYRVLEWEDRTDEEQPLAWDASWTPERIAAELAADRDALPGGVRHRSARRTLEGRSHDPTRGLAPGPGRVPPSRRVPRVRPLAGVAGRRYPAPMPIDPELLEILVCPETHQPVKMADDDLIASINGRIKAGGVKNHQGDVVSAPVAEGLVREDGKCLYVIDDGIPNMLIDERIDL